MQVDLEAWESNELLKNELNDEKYFKIKNRLDQKLQNDYMDDPKRTIRKITVKSSPMCSIEPDIVEQFWKNRWEQNPYFNEEETDDLFPVKRFFEKEMNVQMITDTLDKEKLMELIKKRGNQSAQAWMG
jgi:hypothetical protein